MLWHASSGMPHFASLMNCLYPDREVVDMLLGTCIKELLRFSGTAPTGLPRVAAKGIPRGVSWRC